MPTTTAPDGTALSYETTGAGPALVLVDGAMCHRGGGPMRAVAAAVSDRFTVTAYDRRGRGESTDTTPYDVHREIEDLRTVIAATGGRAAVYGMSSGAVLALRAAAVAPEISALALYEPPLLGELDDEETTAQAAAYTRTLSAALTSGRPGDAVAAFLRSVGAPADAVEGMRTSPAWDAMVSIAPTLAYDDTLMGDGRVPPDVARDVTVPTLVMTGSESPLGLQRAAEATAVAIGAAELVTLPDQTHDVDPGVLASALTRFLHGSA
ncbi:pimeloyl-ACP methyl ester carboxylesterase [Mumia flava]|uniref:Pimeloyl-ACP methyl ester carboxylesterase n=1 Tax=Mumia flava TaxID=1348852 RepID=A0A0B2BAI1_9ACTN|nr:alpha/beta hydrolase [Mumia flava]PJJ48259.1 pimeloyl-ACP methyl ester carboxylesterase [Mumia flava]